MPGPFAAAGAIVNQKLVFSRRKWKNAITSMKTVLVIDNDQAFRSQLAPWLGERGWSLINTHDTQRGVELAMQHKPEIVLCDLLTPGCNGFQFCRDIRRQKDTQSGFQFIIATGSANDIDKINALEAGADEYMVKPVALHSLGQLLARFDSTARHGQSGNAANGGVQGGDTRIKFWGVRGSIPSPGPETVFYGGNTSCVEVRVGSDIIILDAGSGLRRLGLSLIDEFKNRPMELNLLITHTHWDHIQGFPFFLPAYNPKNDVTIYGYEGASQGLQSTLSSQMESPYFPISMQQMPGHIAIHELREMQFNINQVVVRAHFLNHPGICTGYRLMTPGGSVSYLPDIELHQSLRDRWNTDTALVRIEDRKTSPPEDHDLIEFIRDSDVLIMDSQYDASEYEKHIGWGHSCAEDTVAFALHANVKRLFLFHHDPDHADEKISHMVARARQVVAQRRSNLIVEAAREGFELVLANKAQAQI
jgi:phosphoribosyl 1,2-cyclic phosphodiesterase/ActR/RegA family two-component response regulator